jgi:hypothetical protein
MSSTDQLIRALAEGEVVRLGACGDRPALTICPGGAIALHWRGRTQRGHGQNCVHPGTGRSRDYDARESSRAGCGTSAPRSGHGRRAVPVPRDPIGQPRVEKPSAGVVRRRRRGRRSSAEAVSRSARRVVGHPARVNRASKKPATLCARFCTVNASRSRSTRLDIVVFVLPARNEMTNAPPSSTSRASSCSPCLIITSREPLRTARASGSRARTPATIAADHSGKVIALPGGGTSLRIASDSSPRPRRFARAGQAFGIRPYFLRPKSRPGALFAAFRSPASERSDRSPVSRKETRLLPFEPTGFARRGKTRPRAFIRPSFGQRLGGSRRQIGGVTAYGRPRETRPLWRWRRCVHAHRRVYQMLACHAFKRHSRCAPVASDAPLTRTALRGN